MQKRMKWLTGTVVILMVMALISACSNGDNKETTNSTETKTAPKQITIGWSPPDITGVFKTATDYMEKAAAEAKKAGIDVKIITRAATSHTAIADQVNSINNLVQSKVDVLIVSPSDVEAVKPAVKEAIDAGIPVIMVNMLEPIEGLDISSYIGFDNAQAAKVAAYSLLDALGGPGVLKDGEQASVQPGDYLDLAWWENLYKNADPASIKGNIAIIEGVAGDFFSNERKKGFHEVIDKYPNIKVMQTLSADWNRQKGLAAAENILQSNAKLDAIWAASNEMGLGAVNAVKNAGRQAEVMVLTNDGTPESVDALRSGDLLAETWHGFPEWGWYGTKFAVMLALGEEVPKAYDIRPRVEYKANADLFYPNPKLEAINWEEILGAAK
jgi:ribose transport system substrate-binding protein